MASISLKRVRVASDDDGHAVSVHLFRNAHRQICGWFIGPIAFAPIGVSMPYLPRSHETLATVAVVRAIDAAKLVGAPICIVDPQDLWVPAWQVD